MAVTDVFSTRRRLDSPVGIPRDFLGSAVHDPNLTELNSSPLIEEWIQRDTMPIPSARDREGYYGERHFEFWLSGLSDYLKTKDACSTLELTGAKLLDFGGATGRVARHFWAQETMAEVMVCDVNINNVDWVIEHLPRQFKAFKNSPTPSLPIPDGYFDVVTAFSVFTHMREYELAWLYELKRILKPNGFLYASVHNDETWNILPSTWVYQTLIQSADFRKVYSPNTALLERKVFDYSTESVYNCNTFHSNSYIQRVWGKIFTVSSIRPLCHGYQAGIALRNAPA